MFDNHDDVSVMRDNFPDGRLHSLTSPPPIAEYGLSTWECSLSKAKKLHNVFAGESLPRTQHDSSFDFGHAATNTLLSLGLHVALGPLWGNQELCDAIGLNSEVDVDEDTAQMCNVLSCRKSRVARPLGAVEHGLHHAVRFQVRRATSRKVRRSSA